MTKVAILYICTGKYTVFWDEFFCSSERFLLPDCEKHYFVFTEADELSYERECERIHRIFQESLPWPYASLLRYSFFLRIEDELKNFDYIYFFNANAEILMTVTEDMLLPRKDMQESMVYVQHLAFYDKPNYLWTYDRNSNSHAYIPYGEGEAYIVGGINGGKAGAFLEMCRTIVGWTNADLERDIIALWHDESYINKYAYLNSGYRLLPPEYVYPEGWGGYSKLDPIIQMRSKERYFSVESVKAKAPATELDFAQKLRNWCAYTYYDTKYLIKTKHFFREKEKRMLHCFGRVMNNLLGDENYKKMIQLLKQS